MKRAKRYLAKSARTCICCHKTIPAGTEYYGYRERALTYHEACHAGRYPLRHMCPDCVVTGELTAGNPPDVEVL